MASLNFSKATSGRVASMRRHLDTDERLTHEHSNADIDRARTRDNYFIGCDNWDEMYFGWKDRVRAVDHDHPPTRVRADRKTACMVTCPCPWLIVEAGHERDFFDLINEILAEKIGAENVHGLTVHRDEVHRYIDKDGSERMSMIHCHGLITPYAHWMDSKGIAHEGVNAKHFMTRDMLLDFNDTLNQRCLERFGIELNTHGLAQHKTVEDLKREGEARDFERQIDDLIAYRERLLDSIDELEHDAYDLACEVVASHEAMFNRMDDYIRER